MSKRGLTLVEVLITLVIFSLVIIVAGSVLIDTLNIKNALDRRKNMTVLSTGALRLITDELRCAYRGRGQKITFIGEDKEIDGLPADTLTFVCTAYSQLKGHTKGALLKVTYSLEEDSDMKCLNLIRSETILSAPGAAEESKEVICRGISALNFKYYDGEEWQKEWQGGGGPVSPSKSVSYLQAVEVTINFDERYFNFIPEDAALKPKQSSEEDSIFDKSGEVKGFKTIVSLPAPIM